MMNRSLLAFLLLLTTALSLSAALNDGMVLYYPFDTDGGSLALDQSGAGNNGTIYSATFTTNGRFGGGYNFDGSNDYIKLPPSATLNTPDHFSLCAFFRSTRAGPQQPILSWHTPTMAGVHMCTQIYGYQWQGRGTGAHLMGVDGVESVLEHVISVNDPPIDQWHYLVITYNRASGVGKLYLDGVLARVQSMGSYEPQMSFEAYVGAIPAVLPEHWLRFVGQLDEIRVYNRIISADEVLALYENRANADPAWITLIGFSDAPEGDQDVTEFFTDETLYIRVRDVDLEGMACAGVRVTFKQPRVSTRFLDLTANEDGSFTGSLPLSVFNPGTVKIGILGRHTKGKALQKDAEIHLSAPP